MQIKLCLAAWKVLVGRQSLPTRNVGHSNPEEAPNSNSIACYVGSHYTNEPHGFHLWKIFFGWREEIRVWMPILSPQSGVRWQVDLIQLLLSVGDTGPELRGLLYEILLSSKNFITLI